MGPRNRPLRALEHGSEADAFAGLTVPLRVAASLLGISTYTLDKLIADGVFVVEREDGSPQRVIALPRVLAVRRWMLEESAAR